MTKRTGLLAFALPEGEVHLWSTPDEPEQIALLERDWERVLSPEEKARMKRLRHPGRVARLRLGHLLLRRVLAGYLATSPMALWLSRGANGKPQLAGAKQVIAFNLSHAGSKSVFAVARARSIGVDVEATDRATAAYRIAQSFFSKAEKGCIDSAGCKREQRALLMWCLKEAVVKAEGGRVSDGLRNLSFAVGGSRITWEAPTRADQRAVRLFAGGFQKDHILALAVDGAVGPSTAPLEIRSFRFPGIETSGDFRPECTSHRF